MKFFTCIICFYLAVLTVLPSVRAVKMQFAEKCQSSDQLTDPNAETSGCEKGQLVMKLNFSPVQFINTPLVVNTTVIALFEPSEQHNLSYEKVFISTYNNTIWQPPKKTIT